MQLVHEAGVSGSAQVPLPPELEPDPEPEDEPEPEPDDEPDPELEPDEEPELLPELPPASPPLDEPLASLKVDPESPRASADASPLFPSRMSVAPPQ
jgi:hypothetical protein